MNTTPSTSKPNRAAESREQPIKQPGNQRLFLGGEAEAGGGTRSFVAAGSSEVKRIGMGEEFERHEAF
jgi:hypothetical protein